jgi:hypothetical protein
MADEKIAAGDAGGAAAVADTPVVTGTPDPAATTDDTTTDAPAWGDTWREALAGEDKAALKRLQRFAAPTDLYKSLRETENKLRSGQAFAPPSEDAEPAEIAAYQKRMGIPETPEGYGLAFPEGVTPSETAIAELADFQKQAHKLGATPAQTKALFEWYQSTTKEATEQRESTINDLRLENIAELKSEFKGREYQRNVAIANEFLAQHFDGRETELNEILHAKLANGVELANYAPYVRFLFKAARDGADEEALMAGDRAGGSGKSIEDRKAELVAKSVGPGLNKAEDAELNQIYETITARAERQGRGRAA